MPNLEPGALITPTVRLLRPLAEGGMGKVWIADHLGLNTQVVVKMMAEEMAARPDGAERFAREAAACAAIKSPHVVQIFDHGRTPEGVPYMVMELLEGRDLGAHIEEHGRLDPTQVMNLVVQIGKALSKAHRAGIVHRDIKPENIFLCDADDGQLFVKLLDFGTAKRHDASSRTTMPGQIMGTPFYMSPEQSVGRETDERSDIWSLGVVVFEALTGQKPFDGASIGAITMAIHAPLPTMASLVPDIPPLLDDWFARACAQSPDDRFPTVREAMNAIVEAVTGAPPVDPGTESVHLAPWFPAPSGGHGDSGKSSSTPIRPVTRPSLALIDTLPKRSERTTTIAAGAVMAVAGLVMTAIVLGRSPAAPAAAGEATTHAAMAPAEPPPAPEPAPAPVPEVPTAAPHASTPAAPAVMPAASVAKAASHPQPVPRTFKAAPAAKPSTIRPASGARRDDDDLVKLQKASAKHAEGLPSASAATTAPAPAAETPPASTAPPANTAPALPSLPSEPSP